MSTNAAKFLDTGFLADMWVAGGFDALDEITKVQGDLVSTERVITELIEGNLSRKLDTSSIINWLRSNTVVIDYENSTYLKAVNDEAAGLISSAELDNFKEDADERGIIELASGKAVDYSPGSVTVGRDLQSRP